MGLFDFIRKGSSCKCRKSEMTQEHGGFVNPEERFGTPQNSIWDVVKFNFTTSQINKLKAAVRFVRQPL